MRWKKWAVLTIEGGIVLATLYLTAQTFCDINIVDIAPNPATSKKACSFTLPKIPLPDWPNFPQRIFTEPNTPEPHPSSSPKG